MPLLHINSRQKDIGSTSNFKINIKSDLRIGRRFKIAQVMIPNTYYPVNLSTQTLRWVDSGSNQIDSIIPVGSYSPTELASILSSLMTTDSIALDVITVLNVSELGKFSFSTDTPNLTFPANTVTTAGELLGIDTKQSLVIPTIANGQNVYNVSGCNEFFVRSDFQPRDFSYEHTGTEDILIKVPVSGNFGSTLFYVPYYDWYYLSNPRIVNNIYFRLTDCNGNEIDLNGQNWSISLWVE